MTQRLWLYGIHAVEAALENENRHKYRAVVVEPSDAQMFRARKIPVEIIQKKAMDQLLPAGSVHQNIALEVETNEEIYIEDIIANAKENDCVVILDQVTDPHNLGAILRSCCAFGASAVIMTKDHAPQLSGLVAKAASGAIEYTPMVKVTNLVRALEDLKKAGYWCYGLDERGDKLKTDTLNGKVALVFGAEGKGLRQLTKENCDALISLPTTGPISSLNVSNAVAVTLFSYALGNKK